MSLLVEVRFAACSQTPNRIVQDGIDTWHQDGRIYRESFAPGAFIKRARRAGFRLEHDAEDVGEVTVVVAHGPWWIADCVVEDTPAVREAVKPGAKVSLQAQILKSREVADLRLHRVELADLEHIALVADGQRAGYLDGATKILSVRELASPKPAASRQGWRGLLPAGWEIPAKYADHPAWSDNNPPVELIVGRQVVYRWDGERFAAVR
jgi:hypothetical protein